MAASQLSVNNNTDTSIAVKTVMESENGRDVRRVRVSARSVDELYTELCKMIRAIYQLPASAALDLTYLSGGEYITEVFDGASLAEAAVSMPKVVVLNVTVLAGQGPAEVTAPAEELRWHVRGRGRGCGRGRGMGGRHGHGRGRGCKGVAYEDVPVSFREAMFQAGVKNPRRICKLYRRFDGDAVQAASVFASKTGRGQPCGVATEPAVPEGEKKKSFADVAGRPAGKAPRQGRGKPALEEIPQEFQDAIREVGISAPGRIRNLYRRFDGDATRAADFAASKREKKRHAAVDEEAAIEEEFRQALEAVRPNIKPRRVACLHRRFDGEAEEAAAHLARAQEQRAAKLDAKLEDVPEHFREALVEARPNMKPQRVLCLHRRFEGDAKAALEFLGKQQKERTNASDFLERAKAMGFEREWMLLRLREARGEEEALELLAKRRDIIVRKEAAEQAVLDAKTAFEASKVRFEAAKAARSSIYEELAASRSEFRMAVHEAKEKKKTTQDTTDVPQPFATELEMLSNMGFCDSEDNLAALIKHDCNIGNAVNTLLAR
mmetsp:Transcript_13283/g.37763  ORF Transcript_13283/g.37763 Transcript_13283/m.37763 type:complete len:550 (+) Transcript_13283:124-1773(+)|eukprot:CAMPEP_0119130718 /NCGR_PEP_ID=MMETSP1310-20130426/8527_1 /TAXON_ID=464262 /ORGANISM="Genus nov. species nov., Strain RCC2339" /LENGTH=549 /DNA_ID=CAMNT_0007121247 /DNA_START=95 /DNA_END=1744 /DNA_ORIENTATION=+